MSYEEINNLNIKKINNFIILAIDEDKEKNEKIMNIFKLNKKMNDKIFKLKRKMVKKELMKEYEEDSNKGIKKCCNEIVKLIAISIRKCFLNGDILDLKAFDSFYNKIMEESLITQISNEKRGGFENRIEKEIRDTMRNTRNLYIYYREYIQSKDTKKTDREIKKDFFSKGIKGYILYGSGRLNFKRFDEIYYKVTGKKFEEDFKNKADNNKKITDIENEIKTIGNKSGKEFLKHFDEYEILHDLLWHTDNFAEHLTKKIINEKERTVDIGLLNKYLETDILEELRNVDNICEANNELLKKNILPGLDYIKTFQIYIERIVTKLTDPSYKYKDELIEKYLKFTTNYKERWLNQLCEEKKSDLYIEQIDTYIEKIVDIIIEHKLEEHYYKYIELDQELLEDIIKIQKTKKINEGYYGNIKYSRDLDKYFVECSKKIFEDGNYDVCVEIKNQIDTTFLDRIYLVFLLYYTEKTKELQNQILSYKIEENATILE